MKLPIRVVSALATAATALPAVALGVTTGAAPAGASSSFKVSAPVKLGFLWEIKGESSEAISDYNNGAMLAVQQINKAGGIGGKQVTTVRVPASASDPQALVNNFLKEAADDPTVMMGIPALDVEALTRSIKQAGIPLLLNTSDDTTQLGAANGTKWTFQIYPSEKAMADAAAQYVVENLHAKSVGLLHTNEPFGNAGSQYQAAYLKSKKIKIVAQQGYDPEATDLTQQVLAVKGADAVIDWGYPNPVAVQVQEFAQNGMDIPTMGNQAPELDFDYGILKGSQLDNLYGTGECNMAQPVTAKGKAFATAYKAKYGVPASTFAGLAYDSVYIAQAAIDKAKSTSPDAIRKALTQITYSGGVCAPTYHADSKQVMNHYVAVVGFKGGSEQTLKAFNTPAN